MENKKKRSTVTRERPVRRVDTDRLKDDAKKLGNDYILPRFKLAVQESLSNVFDILIWGKVRGGRGNSGNFVVKDFTKGNNNTNYNAISTQQQSSVIFAGSNSWKFEDVVFSTPEEATAVWYQLNDILKQEGMLTVNRYYDICEADVKVPYTYENYGWTNIGDSPKILAKNFNGEAMYVIAMPNIRYVGGR